jgi:hypothetical protein
MKKKKKREAGVVRSQREASGMTIVGGSGEIFGHGCSHTVPTLLGTLLHFFFLLLKALTVYALAQERLFSLSLQDPRYYHIWENVPLPVSESTQVMAVE